VFGSKDEKKGTVARLAVKTIVGFKVFKDPKKVFFGM
jgi:hypothetical protein